MTLIRIYNFIWWLLFLQANVAAFFVTETYAMATETGNVEPMLSSGNHCVSGDAIKTDGHHRLALIIGVGEYKAKNVTDLEGPPNDAQRFYDLLTGKNGYGFPRENVCMLVNEQATLYAFRKAFENRLITRAQEGDIAVLYFAGHGSQCRDRNGDEPDEQDETLLFHDSRSEGIKDLSDDELNSLLTRLHGKTKHVVVILDSCNSGTATRIGDDTYVARWQSPGVCTQVKSLQDTGDGTEDWVSESLSGLVTFTAASDGTSALETGGRGVFTDAVLEVLGQVGQQPLTYAQASRQIPPLVASKSPQIPYFQGELGGLVFGNTSRDQPLAWAIRSVDKPTDPDEVSLVGPPLPGIGKGALFRVYAGSTSGSDTRDPSKTKATLVVDTTTGLNATAKVIAMAKDTGSVQIGDLAVLAQPGDEYNKIKFRIRPENEPGGLLKDTVNAIRETVRKHDEANLLVDFTTGDGDFELSLNAQEEPILKGPENRIRNTFTQQTERELPAAVAEVLWQHARQKALLQLRGEGGNDFTDQDTLKVRLVPINKQTPCADGRWEQADWNQEQVVPLCHRWQVEVKLSEKAKKPLLVGGVFLSSDGDLIGFPSHGDFERLKPGGKSYKFKKEIVQGGLPLDVQDRLIIFGTQESNRVPWRLLTDTARARSPETERFGTLYRALHRYLTPGARGGQQVDEAEDDTTWTLTTILMRTEANSRFLKTGVDQDQIDKREYTITNFDIRPYLPDETSTTLYKVLKTADELAQASASDGYSYKQHDWSQSTDIENLKVGIDCSRAIWFAFTRAGLSYNRNNDYLATAQMVPPSTLMKDQFQSCMDDDRLRIGDILVYRDDERGDGHTVMVIDPRKRIAWGSHGWDGNARTLKVEPDTGVEYQLIKYKKDWERWDRKNMRLKACWRYRQFIAEAKTPRGQPGINALKNACNPKLCRRKSVRSKPWIINLAAGIEATAVVNSR